MLCASAPPGAAPAAECTVPSGSPRGEFPVLRDRRLPAIDRPAPRRATVLAVVALAALPATAQAGNFKLEGVVTGPPSARGGAVIVPLKVTPRVGRALNFGTRNVSVRLARRARLRLSGAGASGASGILPTGLRARDRVRGVTSLSRRARVRLRWHARPTLKLTRATVVRPAPRAPAPRRSFGPPGAGAPSGGLGAFGPPVMPVGQVVARLTVQTNSLSSRSDEAGPLVQKIEAQGPQLETLKNGLKDVTTTFESLRSALQGLAGQVDQTALDELLAEVETLRLRVEALEDGIGGIDSTLGELEGALSKVRGSTEKLAEMVAGLASQVGVVQHTAGAEAIVTSLDAATSALAGRLDTVEAGLDSLASRTAALIAGMASLVADVNALAAAAGSGADLATLSAGVADLAPAVDALEAGFGGLGATSEGLLPVAEAIETEAPELETAAAELCSLVPTVCP
jgi:chaperonin cofactor prefoldin